MIRALVCALILTLRRYVADAAEAFNKELAKQRAEAR